MRIPWWSAVAFAAFSVATEEEQVSFQGHYQMTRTTSNLQAKADLTESQDVEVTAYSPPYHPSPWASGDGGWDEAVKRAREFVSQLTLPEKVNLTTGVGYGFLHRVTAPLGSFTKLNLSQMDAGRLRWKCRGHTASRLPVALSAGLSSRNSIRYVHTEVEG